MGPCGWQVLVCSWSLGGLSLLHLVTPAVASVGTVASVGIGAYRSGGTWCFLRAHLAPRPVLVVALRSAVTFYSQCRLYCPSDPHPEVSVLLHLDKSWS